MDPASSGDDGKMPTPTPTLASPLADGRSVSSIVRKLQHPLVRIRARALANLLFKAREKLVDLATQSRAEVEELTWVLLQCLGHADLERDTLLVLRVLLGGGCLPRGDTERGGQGVGADTRGVRLLLGSLQHHGAATIFQRGTIRARAELRTTYEELLRQLLTTMADPATDAAQREKTNWVEMPFTKTPPPPQPASKTRTTTGQAGTTAPPLPSTPITIGSSISLSSSSSLRDGLATRGWRFPNVALATVDEQFLFEFEVKWMLRTTVPEIVGMCDVFRRELLRDFPPEVFLERPAVLQHLCQLVQQPVLPGPQDSSPSFGVNYFDDDIAASSTASSAWKPSARAAAVHVSSLKAIESFIAALRHGQQVSLNPVFHVYDSAHDPDMLFPMHDGKRLWYPRMLHRYHDRGGGDDETEESQAEGFSLSGAMFQLVMSLLPLIRAHRQQRQYAPLLHVVNLLHATIDLLPERGVLPSHVAVHGLDKDRFEAIFQVVSDIFNSDRPSGDAMGDTLFHEASVRVGNLVVRLLRVYPASRYIVTASVDCVKFDDEGGTTEKDRVDPPLAIVIPENLWTFVLQTLSTVRNEFPAVAGVNNEGGIESDEHERTADTSSTVSVVNYLNEIDPSAQDIMTKMHDASRIAEQLRRYIARDAPVSELVSSPKHADDMCDRMRMATQVISLYSSLDHHHQAAATNAIVETIGDALSNPSRTATSDEIALLRQVFLELLTRASPDSLSRDRDLSDQVFDKLLSLIADDAIRNASKVSADAVAVIPAARENLVRVVTSGDGIVLQQLLLVLLSRHEPERMPQTADIYWIIGTAIIHELSVTEDNEALRSCLQILPLLQHFAYADPTGDILPSQQRFVQRDMVTLINRVEAHADELTKALLVCRCLLHRSNYIRKAAASGLYDIISQAGLNHIVSAGTPPGIVAMNDPFGSFVSSDTGRGVNRSVENDMASLDHPQPVSSNGEAHSGSSKLTRISKLRRLIATMSSSTDTESTVSVFETTLRQLYLELNNASAIEFTMILEAGEVEELFTFILGRLFVMADQTGQANSSGSYRAAMLSIVRIILVRSLAWRAKVRSDSHILLTGLLPFVFDLDARVRATMYFIILALTCSAEVFAMPVDISPGFSSIPVNLKATFGLFSSRWALYGVDTCSIATTKLESSSPSKGVHHVDDGRNGDALMYAAMKLQTDNKTGTSPHRDPIPLVWDELRSVNSFRTFLDALYCLLELCQSNPRARRSVCYQWEHSFSVYFEQTPTSTKDDVILSSLLGLLNAVLDDMDSSKQVRVVLVLRRVVIPLLRSPDWQQRRSGSRSLVAQLLRLVLHISHSPGVSDLFTSLVTDTDLVKLLVDHFLTIATADPVVHSMCLHLLLRVVLVTTTSAPPLATQPSANAHTNQAKLLLPAIPAILSAVCRHRVPGSFVARSIFVDAVQCLVAIDRAKMHSHGNKINTDDGGLSTRSHWSARLMFDTTSTMRALGFTLLGRRAAAGLLQDTAGDSNIGTFRLAFDTMRDETECDAVRAAAAGAVHAFLDHSPSPAELSLLATHIHGKEFTRTVFTDLKENIDGGKQLAQLHCALVRLVRMLVQRASSMSADFGDARAQLTLIDGENDIYPSLLQLFSVQRAYALYRSHFRKCMRTELPDDAIWFRSVLPGTLSTIVDLARLFQELARAYRDIPGFLALHTTAVGQLVELVVDLSKSIDSVEAKRLPELQLHRHPESGSIWLQRLHYEAIEETSALLVVVLSTKENERVSRIPVSVSSRLTAALSSLMNPRHPFRFRLSICRLVVVLGSKSVFDNSSGEALRLSVKLWAMYKNTINSQPLSRTRDFLGSDRRASMQQASPLAYALQVLLQRCSDARDELVHQQAVQTLVTAVKECFAAIRMAGGFGGKSVKSKTPSTSGNDAFLVELCECVTLHCRVLAGLVCSESAMPQDLICSEQFARVLAGNWNTMRMAHQRRSRVLTTALQALQNSIHQNELAKASLVVAAPTAKVSGSGGDRTLLLLVFQLAVRPTTSNVGSIRRTQHSSSSPVDPEWAVLACSILKSAFLNAECMSYAIKNGLIAKLIARVMERCKPKSTQVTQGNDHTDVTRMVDLLAVLASVACSEDGVNIIAQTHDLRHLVVDILNFEPGSDELLTGTLLIRNMALSKLTRSHFAMWESTIDTLVGCLRRNRSPAVMTLLSSALQSLVFDNQRAQTVFSAKQAAIEAIQDAAYFWGAEAAQPDGRGDVRAPAILQNLERALELLGDVTTPEFENE